MVPVPVGWLDDETLIEINRGIAVQRGRFKSTSNLFSSSNTEEIREEKKYERNILACTFISIQGIQTR